MAQTMDDPARILPQVIGSLAAWDVQVAHVELVAQSENIVYKVVAEDGACFALRLHRPNYRTLAELNSEHEWTESLAQAGFLLPHAHNTKSGAWYFGVEIGQSTRYVGLVDWLEGASLFDLTREGRNPELLHSTVGWIGETLGSLHTHAETWRPSANFTRPRMDVDGFFGQHPHWGRYWEAPLLRPDQRTILDRTRPHLIEALTDLGLGQRVFGMTHMDLHHGNVFLSGAEIYLIDFDAAGFGWYLYDIAVALQEYQQREDFLTLQSTLLSGYRKYRPLLETEENLIPLFLHIRSRATIGWASARPELDNTEKIEQLIEHTCAEAEALL